MCSLGLKLGMGILKPGFNMLRIGKDPNQVIFDYEEAMEKDHEDEEPNELEQHQTDEELTEPERHCEADIDDKAKGEDKSTED